MNTNIDLMWSSIKHTIDSAMELVPSKFTSSRYSQPWVTVMYKRLSRRKKRAYNRAKRIHLKDDWGIFQALKKETMKQYARAYNKFLRDSICPNIRNNPKKFFSFIKSRKMEHVGEIVKAEFKLTTKRKPLNSMTNLRVYFQRKTTSHHIYRRLYA